MTMLAPQAFPLDQKTRDAFTFFPLERQEDHPCTSARHMTAELVGSAKLKQPSSSSKALVEADRAGDTIAPTSQAQAC
jgi:hypothetical protein